MTKRKLSFLILILSLSFSLTSCSSVNSKELAQTVYESYAAYKENIESEAMKIAEDPQTIISFKSKTPLNLSGNTYFTKSSYYDIQGKSLTNPNESLRGTTSYQRLMGHLDFFSTIQDKDGEAALVSICKLMEPDPYHFIGIVELVSPLKNFREELNLPENKKVLLIDPGKTIVELSTLKAIKFENMSDNLKSLVKDASLFEEKEGTISLTDEEIKGNYFYKTGNSFTVAVETGN